MGQYLGKFSLVQLYLLLAYFFNLFFAFHGLLYHDLKFVAIVFLLDFCELFLVSFQEFPDFLFELVDLGVLVLELAYTFG